ncbi:MAG: tetratricopeptide repeat protein [Candidatus Gracilibacteria bacterium]|nr:tetratricopeptide repeat protein [Candidatus Gracilibacteria bacterium]
MQNYLSNKVYEDDTDLKTLENLLNTLDNITPIYVSRDSYDSIKGKILEKTGKVGRFEKYNLYLPSDLKVGEQLYIINLLIKEFNLEKKSNFNQIISDIKVLVGIILKDKGEEGEDYLLLLVREYNLDESFVVKILRHKITPTKETKGFIDTIKQGVNGNDEVVEKGTKELSGILSKEFDLTFFRRSIDMINLAMKTITLAEQKSLIEYCEVNGYKKLISEKGELIYKKGEEMIVINDLNSKLDKNALLLRNKIGINKLKKELNQARKSKNKEKIIEIEKKATNLILENLSNYPYKVTKNNYGYQPKGIVENKEIHCIGFCLIGHAFLKELGINHSGLQTENHIFLEVNIGGKTYGFDPTYLRNIEEIRYNQINKIFKGAQYIENNKEKTEKLEVQVFKDVEKLLLSNIYKMKSLELINEEKKDEALKMIEKSIEITPDNLYLYNEKGNVLTSIGDNLEDKKYFIFALKSYYKALSLGLENENIYNNIGCTLLRLGSYKKNKKILERAILVFKKVIEINPNYASAHSNIGLIQTTLGNYNEALKMFNKTLELNPTNIKTYYNKISIFDFMGETELVKIYTFLTDILSGKIKRVDLQEISEKEKEVVGYLKAGNYTGLVEYLVSLEKDIK